MDKKKIVVEKTKAIVSTSNKKLTELRTRLISTLPIISNKNVYDMSESELQNSVIQLREKIAHIHEAELLNKQPGGNFVLLTNYSAGDITTLNVTDEHFASWKTSYSHKEKLQLRSDPVITSFDGRKFLRPIGIKQRIRRKLFGKFALWLGGFRNYGKFVFNLWLAEVTGEFTFPIKDQTPEEAKQEAERQNMINAKATEGDIFKSMDIAGRGRDDLMKAIAPLIAIVGIVFIMSYFFSGA